MSGVLNEYLHSVNFLSKNLRILRSLQWMNEHQRVKFGQKARQRLLSSNTSGSLSASPSTDTPNVVAASKLGPVDAHFHFDPTSSNINTEWTYKVVNSMLIYPNFISQDEETTLMAEIEPYISRLHYESSHWDDAINDYRETERSKWSKKNTLTINRIRSIGFPPGVPQLKLVHILDLAQKGQIKPHIDSVRFCGNTIAGLSLLSDCVMRLRHDAQKDFYCDVLLPQMSLYVMSDFVRYEFTHEILGETDSKFKETHVPRKRRISIVCRNEPPEETSPGPVFIPILD